MFTAHVWHHTGRIHKRRRFGTIGGAHRFANKAIQRGHGAVREVTITEEGDTLTIDSDGFTEWGPRVDTVRPGREEVAA